MSLKLENFVFFIFVSLSLFFVLIQAFLINEKIPFTLESLQFELHLYFLYFSHSTERKKLELVLIFPWLSHELIIGLTLCRIIFIAPVAATITAVASGSILVYQNTSKSTMFCKNLWGKNRKRISFAAS